MKKLMLGIALIGLSVSSITSYATLPDLVVNRSGGFLGHYKNISSSSNTSEGHTMTVLNCSDPGWERCLLSNASSATVTIGNVEITDNLMDEINNQVDGAIANNSQSGNFLVANNQLYVEWTFDGTTILTNIFNNQN